mmetsp:Transcript_29133/g.74973  ORF Transcript_29133/g.74973 Transcript_29133/m.74973 type:complete len:528 (+) Transcript_29133:1739-3322(+)
MRRLLKSGALLLMLTPRTLGCLASPFRVIDVLGIDGKGVEADASLWIGSAVIELLLPVPRARDTKCALRRADGHLIHLLLREVCLQGLNLVESLLAAQEVLVDQREVLQGAQHLVAVLSRDGHGFVEPRSHAKARHVLGWRPLARRVLATVGAIHVDVYLRLLDLAIENSARVIAQGEEGKGVLWADGFLDKPLVARVCHINMHHERANAFDSPRGLLRHPRGELRRTLVGLDNLLHLAIRDVDELFDPTSRVPLRRLQLPRLALVLANCVLRVARIDSCTVVCGLECCTPLGGILRTRLSQGLPTLLDIGLEFSAGRFRLLALLTQRVHSPVQFGQLGLHLLLALVRRVLLFGDLQALLVRLLSGGVPLLDVCFHRRLRRLERRLLRHLRVVLLFELLELLLFLSVRCLQLGCLTLEEFGLRPQLLAAKAIEAALVLLQPTEAFDVLLKRLVDALEVTQALALSREPLLDSHNLPVELDKLLVLAVHLRPDGHLGMLEQLDWRHVRELPHLVLWKELERVVHLNVE